jgi:hypothetical protein
MGSGKTQVALIYSKLPDQAAVTRAKQDWSERLAALEELLASQ